MDRGVRCAPCGDDSTAGPGRPGRLAASLGLVSKRFEMLPTLQDGWSEIQTNDEGRPLGEPTVPRCSLTKRSTPTWQPHPHPGHCGPGRQAQSRAPGVQDQGLPPFLHPLTCPGTPLSKYQPTGSPEPPATAHRTPPTCSVQTHCGENPWVFEPSGRACLEDGRRWLGPRGDKHVQAQRGGAWLVSERTEGGKKPDYPGGLPRPAHQPAPDT